MIEGTETRWQGGPPAPGAHRPVVAGRSRACGHRRRRRSSPLSFDPDSLKPRIIAAVKQATGRDLTLQGRIRLGLSLQPTLTVQGVAFANPPGFSRPQMATLEQLDLKLALIPLLSHRVEIDRLVLVKPDIILETDAQGRPNWQFTPASSPPAPQPHRRRAGRRSGRGGDQHQRGRCADRERHRHVARWPRRTERRARPHQPAGQRAVARCQSRSDDVGELQRHAIHSGRRVRAAGPAAGPTGRCRLAGAGATGGCRSKAHDGWHCRAADARAADIG